ncbi:NgoMIV family type II restriction endonuclease [Mycobacterium intracellulare]|uniref:NgoMIV family type II restriction endonuclease n=1 Tax=Mycobacterium intracellulare TaxID=1767 RepID=UPI001914E1B9|nr:NgoMIV family type II restriction endonuclease [Mycobacterium intracellulare]
MNDGILSQVPAAFTRDLCGYRADSGKPNTSDSNDELSVELGHALFDELGVPIGTPPPIDPGTDMEHKIVACLRELRPDLRIERSRPASDFAQYAHLDVFPQFRKNFGDLRPALADLTAQVLAADLGSTRARIEQNLERLALSTQQQTSLVENLAEQMPEESLLKIDISVAIPQEGQLDELAVALSSKWSLRTDRAQDCVSQGHKLVAQRRGRMPHFGVITIEPRPAMLRILADGSGAVDFVYHLDLPSLSAAIDDVASRRSSRWSPRRTFGRLLRQHRLRDFDQLLCEVSRVPGP